MVVEGYACQMTSNAEEYIGTLSSTISGHTCQRWDSQTPHAHPYDMDYFFPFETIVEASNYCR